MIDLDAIEQAARAATPGPWRVVTTTFHSCVASEHGMVIGAFGMANYGEDPVNGTFIALANPATVLALIARLRAAEVALWEGISIIQECADYEQMIGDETGCDAGNPDGGGIYPCDHCVAIANATALREKARRLSLVLTPPTDKSLTRAE